MASEPSSGLWRIGYFPMVSRYAVINEYGSVIGRDLLKEHAEYIVRCVNAHDKLVELAERLLGVVRISYELGSESPEVAEQREKNESHIKQVLELAKGNEDD